MKRQRSTGHAIFNLCRPDELLGGVWYCNSSNPAFPLHVDRELELNLLVRGRAQVQVGRDRRSVSAGEMLWVTPGCVHGLVEQSSDLAMWVFLFRESLVDSMRTATRGLGQCRAGEGLCLGWDELDALSRQAYALMRCQSSPARFNVGLGEFLVRAWTARGQATPDVRPPHPAVLRAAHRLDVSREPLALPGLAREVGLSPFQLSRCFHRDMGLPASVYAAKCRVQHFVRARIDHPEWNTLRCAMDAGFGSYAQFFRSFRCVTGLSPAVHQRLIGEGSLPELRLMGSGPPLHA